MKQKKMTKKLLLNKETISNLESKSMKGVLGGATLYTTCCPTEVSCGDTCETCGCTDACPEPTHFTCPAECATVFKCTTGCY